MQRAVVVSVCALLLLVPSALCIKMNMLTKKPKPVPEGKYPFMVSLFAKPFNRSTGQPVERFEYQCTGTIVHSELILTAAHCTHYWARQYWKRFYHDMYVMRDADGYAAPNGRPDEAKAMRISAVYVGWGYSYSCSKYFPSCNPAESNIALLRLKTPLQFDETIYPIGWISHNVPQVYNMTGINYTIAGYGNTVQWASGAEHGHYHLMEGHGLYEEENYSLAVWKYCVPGSPLAKNFTSFHELGMCTVSPKGGATSCRGDGGGPIFFKATGGPAKGKYVQTGVMTLKPGGGACNESTERRMIVGMSLARARGFYDSVIRHMTKGHGGEEIWKGPPDELTAYRVSASGKSKPDCERNRHLDPPDEHGRGEWYNLNTYKYEHVECDRPFGEDNPFLANHDQMI